MRHCFEFARKPADDFAVTSWDEVVASATRDGRAVGDLNEGSAEMIHDVQVDGTFPGDTKLFKLHNPIR